MYRLALISAIISPALRSVVGEPCSGSVYQDGVEAEAAFSFVQMSSRLQSKTALATQSRCGCTGLGSKSLLFKKLVGMYSSELPAQKFCQCALVGSSEALRGKGLGAVIDMHDTVIRINRLPLPQHYADFGQKTDIYFGEPGYGFGNPGYEEHVNFYSDESGGKYTIQSFENEVNKVKARVNCSLADGGEACGRFATLIMKGADAERFNKNPLPFRERFPLNEPGWTPRSTAFPVGYQTDDINTAAFKVLGEKQPSNGFHAFLTFAPLCASMALYGFEGTGTYDGHDMNPVHALDKEHAIYQRLMERSTTDIDLTDYAPRVQLQNLAARGCIVKGDTEEATLAIAETAAAQQVVDQEDKKVCFLVRSVAKSDDISARLEAVATTWAANPSPGAKVYYEQQPSVKMPKQIKEWQLIPTPIFQDDEFQFRENFLIEQFNNTEVKRDCKWMALVDDDIYVNTKKVVEKLRWINSTVPRVIIPEELAETSFGRTSFKLFSDGAALILAKALKTCEMPSLTSDDADLISCMRKIKLQKDVRLEHMKSENIIRTGATSSELLAMVGEDLTASMCSSAMVLQRFLPADMQVYHSMTLGMTECPSELTSIDY